MEAICIAEYDQRTKAREQAEKSIEELTKQGKPTKHIVVPEVGYYDCYGLWFFSSLTDIIRQIAADKFNEEIGRMMHVYLDLEPKKVADGVHPVGVYGNNCLLYKWMAQGYHRGLVVLKDDKAGNMAARIYQESGTWSWMLDDEVTARLTNELDGEYQAVHIASHFKLDPCNETMSYLLLGDGSHLTLDKIKTEKALFRGVDLLTFSACSTGVGTTNKSGREIDGIGYIGETQGAKTVMATLWPVADESTSLLMKDFYRRRTSGLSKIEALRQSQLAMLNGSTKPTKPDVERSSDVPLRYEVDKDKPYAHPYYWAPFVLIGNYR